MFTLYYIPADSYKTAYIIERTRTHLPGSKLHAAASRIFFRETNRKEKSMNKHTVLGLNDAEHKSKQLCGELTRRSRIAAGGGGGAFMHSRGRHHAPE